MPSIELLVVRATRVALGRDERRERNAGDHVNDSLDEDAREHGEASLKRRGHGARLGESPVYGRPQRTENQRLVYGRAADAKEGQNPANREWLHWLKYERICPSCAASGSAYALDMQEHITCIGQTNHRNDRRRFGIKQEDRFLHTYVIGKTGTGKSTLLGNMAKQDLLAGGGFTLIDPHGDLVERLHADAVRAGVRDVIYLNATDPTQPYGYNPLRRVREDRIPLAASGLLEVFKKMWSDAWGVRMEHILRNALYALLEQKDATLSDIPRLFGDKVYRKRIAASLKNEPVRLFWEKEFERYSFSYRADGVASIQNKIGAFLADPVMRRILTEPKEPISLRRIMDEGKVLLVNLGKGRIGEDSSALLGGLLVTTIGLAAYSRADTAPAARWDFFVYVDEFQSFTTLAVANMLSELRKYRVGLTLAHQYLYQLEPEIRHAVLGNAGTVISFRLGAEDAGYISRELNECFEVADLLNLPNHHIYLKLMIDGQPSQPFSAMTCSE